MKSSIAFLGLLFVATINAQAADRDWSVNPTSVLQFFLNDTATYNNGSTEKVDRQSLALEFGRNFGQFEVGPVISYSYYKDDSSTDTNTLIGAYLRFNFVENVPGANFVPFARLSYLSGDLKGTNSTTKATLLRLRGGATWFPVNDFVAIEAYLEHSDRQYSLNSSSTKYLGLSLNGSFVVYF